MAYSHDSSTEGHIDWHQHRTSSEHGTCKTVKATFWPRLSGQSRCHIFECFRFARKRRQTWNTFHLPIRARAGKVPLGNLAPQSPLLSEHGTYMTVTVRFWPWLSGLFENVLSCFLFAKTLNIPHPHLATAWPFLADDYQCQVINIYQSMIDDLY